MYDIAPPSVSRLQNPPVSQRIDTAVPAFYAPPGGMRVALYSHDTMGLGHLRRNLLIADAMSEAPLSASSLLITGAHEANFFRLPQRADLLTLPRWKKDGAGGYQAAQLTLERHDLVRLRAESILSALRVFNPDLIVIDKTPTGAFGELLPTLEYVKRETGARTVLGVRDVLDDPENVAAEWLCPANVEAMESLYDEIWVYGDPNVYNAVDAYSFPASIAAKVVHTGYIDQSSRLSGEASKTTQLLQSLATDLPLVLCCVGGGQDGGQLAADFVRGFPGGERIGVVVGGPFMPAEQLKTLRKAAEQKPNLYVFDFLPEADLLVERADRVVSMAGYNTVCSLLSFGKKALLVPRVTPRREQWIRAARLAELGLVDMLHPADMSPNRLGEWIEGSSTAPRPGSPEIDLGGLSKIGGLASRHFASRCSTRRSPLHPISAT